MIDTNAAIAAIKERLTQAFTGTGIEVQSLPDNEAEATHLQGLGRLSVSYESGDGGAHTSFGLPQGRSTSHQDETSDFQIFIESRKLAGDGGCYDLKDSCKLILSAFKPAPDCGGLFYVSDELFGRDKKRMGMDPCYEMHLGFHRAA